MGQVMAGTRIALQNQENEEKMDAALEQRNNKRIDQKEGEIEKGDTATVSICV